MSVFRLANDHQDPDEIRRACLGSGELFEDPEFLAVDESLFHTRRPPRPIEWKRPKDICNDPKLFVGGAGRLDIAQGMLGDCWLLSAISSLAMYPKLMQRVVPVDQSFTKDYCGMFHFRFWRFGKWVDVVVDDRLPTINNKLVFTHSPERNEFWPSLVEKAYAKLAGSYEALKGGQASEAMEDFTGGLTEIVDLQKAPADLFAIMQKAVQRQTLMACGIKVEAGEPHRTDNGLIKGHNYSVTDARTVNYRGEDMELVRVRNPWANKREYTGAWSDASPQWRGLSDGEKRGMDLIFEDDGEFWMSFADFKANFTTLEMCMLGADSLVKGDNKSWESRVEDGCWRKGSSAGGCRNNPNTFHLNPQYRLTLPDEGDVVIQLMQRDRRRLKIRGIQRLTIGFAVYKLEGDYKDYEEGGLMSKDFFLYHASFRRSDNFLNSRAVTTRFDRLPAGDYVIIPSTFDANQEGRFILRMFNEKEEEEEKNPSELAEASTTEIRPRRRPMVTHDQNSSLDAKFKSIFDDVCGDDDEIDAFELQQLLTSAFKKDLGGKEFSLACSRSLIAVYDTDISGKLSFTEFKETIMKVKKLQAIFNSKDVDKTGALNAYELKSAMREGGYILSNKIVDIIATKFANKKGQISLDDFIHCMNLVQKGAEFDCRKASLVTTLQLLFSC